MRSPKASEAPTQYLLPSYSDQPLPREVRRSRTTSVLPRSFTSRDSATKRTGRNGRDHLNSSKDQTAIGPEIQ